MKGPACVITVGFTIAFVERLESLVPAMPKHVHSVVSTRDVPDNSKTLSPSKLQQQLNRSCHKPAQPLLSISKLLHQG